jgi:hypothetical protein
MSSPVFFFKNFFSAYFYIFGHLLEYDIEKSGDQFSQFFPQYIEAIENPKNPLIWPAKKT